MTLISQLSEPQQNMIRSVVAGKPNYRQVQATNVLRALVRMGFAVDNGQMHTPTPAGKALIDEELLRLQTARDFHYGQKVEYSNWTFHNGSHQHEWTPAVVQRVGSTFLRLKLADGTTKQAHPRHVRSVKA